MPIPAIAASAPAAPSVRATRAGQQSESFEPVFDNASKPAPKEESSDTPTQGDAKPPLSKVVMMKSVKNSDPTPKKSDASPVVVAPDPTPQPAEPAPVLKAPEAPAEQPRPILQPVVPVEAFVLPALVAPAPAAPAAAPTPTDQTPAIAPADSTQSEAPAQVDPGTLVFQLLLNSSDGSAKPQPAPAATNTKAEATALPELEPAPFTVETRTGGSNAEAKNQDQQEQPAPAPQPVPAGSDGTIASQFGFQSPMSFAAHIAAPKVEAAAPVAPTRPVENVSTPELPGTGTVDRIALTIRGESDQVVRVEINQSGEMVRVGVNTTNSELASDLRASVPELVHRLDQQGYDAKVNIPSYSSLSASVPIATAQSEFRSGADSGSSNKSQGDITTQDEPRQQRQRNPQKAWRELAAQLQEDL